MNLPNVLLHCVIKYSSESKIIDIRVIGSIAKIAIHNEDIIENLNMDASQYSTTVFRIHSCYFFSKYNPEHPVLSCYLSLNNIAQVLRTNEFGYYVPAEDKKMFFNEIKQGYSLAYGKHIAQYKWLFQIKSSSDVFHTIISDLNDIDISFE